MNTYQKIKLYVLSLSLLFAIIAIVTVSWPKDLVFELCTKDVTCSNIDKIYNGLKLIWVVISENVLPILMCICLLVCRKFKRDFEYFLKGGGQQVIHIQKIKSEDYEHLTFLATYIIPFFGFTFEDPRRLVAYLLLLIVIGVMFVKTDKYYANPTLAIIGFKLYRATLSDNRGVYESVLVISPDELREKEVVHYELIDNDVFYVKKKNRSIS